jgi:hypothetical protein
MVQQLVRAKLCILGNKSYYLRNRLVLMLLLLLTSLVPRGIIVTRSSLFRCGPSSIFDNGPMPAVRGL